QAGNPHDAEGAQVINGGNQAGLIGGLHIGSDGLPGSGAERESGFDLTDVGIHLGTEAVEGQAVGVHGIGDEHAAHGHQGGDGGINGSGKGHKSNDGAGAGGDGIKRNAESAGNALGA